MRCTICLAPFTLHPMMFVCCSFTARKGLNVLIYWIIVRVLSSSRPYQALTDIQNKSKQANPDQRQNFHFHLSHLVPSNSAENWYLGQPHQSTAHKLLKIWQNSNEHFHFHLNNLLLVQLTASAHKLIENCMILYENEYVFSQVAHKIVICFYDIFTFVTWKIFMKCTMC